MTLLLSWANLVEYNTTKTAANIQIVIHTEKLLTVLLRFTNTQKYSETSVIYEENKNNRHHS